ncbi:alpha/beta hydrolase [Caenimonas terrae]|uniref:Alpha/beta hydrolase n=1 Tax=Caenimonas terrae TaxID=696074 RepID=A0ABW0N938_9BURK
MSWFQGFDEDIFAVNGTEIFARVGGTRGKPPLLLLHGFPQTHAIWHRVAQELQRDFLLVLPDLRGYGDSQKPQSVADHANYSKREMAADMAALMTMLGHERFFLCGHDRGGRVAHRLALDHAQRVRKLCVLDIAPTLDMYEGTDLAFARSYFHWFLLIQPAPLPEMMIGPNARAWLHVVLGSLGTGGLDFIEPQALAEYERCFCRAESIHAACEDYRASAGIDLEHDRESRARGQQIACDLLVLCGERGVVQRLFDPQALWQAQCSGKVDARAVAAGHLIPEELHQQTAQALRGFFA